LCNVFKNSNLLIFDWSFCLFSIVIILRKSFLFACSFIFLTFICSTRSCNVLLVFNFIDLFVYWMFSCNCFRSFIIFFLHVFLYLWHLFVRLIVVIQRLKFVLLVLFFELVLLMQDQIKHNDKEVELHKELFLDYVQFFFKLMQNNLIIHLF
jgi:hypothetical protein